MYNKLFTKILDSSIWLEDAHIRLVWITFLAVMDQEGVVALSGVGNVAQRARVTEAQAAEAIEVLEGPDLRNPDQENEGRRIERIPGIGWVVLNAGKYRDIIRAEEVRAQTRERVRRLRESRNATVTVCNDFVTPSEAEAEAEAKKSKRGGDPPTDPRKNHPAIVAIREVTAAYPPKDIWDELIDTLGTDIDQVKMKKAYTRWRVKGFNKTNYNWALDWYLNGIPEEKKNGTSRTNSNGRESNAARIAKIDSVASKYPSEQDRHN